MCTQHLSIRMFTRTAILLYTHSIHMWVQAHNEHTHIYICALCTHVKIHTYVRTYFAFVAKTYMLTKESRKELNSYKTEHYTMYIHMYVCTSE